MTIFFDSSLSSSFSSLLRSDGIMLGGAAGGLDVQGAIGRGRVSPAAVHSPEQQGGGSALRTEQGVVLPLGFLRIADQPPVVPKHFLQIVVADVVVGVEELLGQRR